MVFNFFNLFILFGISFISIFFSTYYRKISFISIILFSIIFGLLYKFFLSPEYSLQIIESNLLVTCFLLFFTGIFFSKDTINRITTRSYFLYVLINYVLAFVLLLFFVDIRVALIVSLMLGVNSMLGLNINSSFNKNYLSFILIINALLLFIFFSFNVLNIFIFSIFIYLLYFFYNKYLLNVLNKINIISGKVGILLFIILFILLVLNIFLLINIPIYFGALLSGMLLSKYFATNKLFNFNNYFLQVSLFLFYSSSIIIYFYLNFNNYFFISLLIFIIYFLIKNLSLLFSFFYYKILSRNILESLISSNLVSEILVASVLILYTRDLLQEYWAGTIYGVFIISFVVNVILQENLEKINILITKVTRNKIAYANNYLVTTSKNNIKENFNIILIGYGKYGRQVSRALDLCKEKYIVIDSLITNFNQLKNRGVPVVYGDARSVEILENANVSKAKIAIVCVNELFSLEDICLSLHKVNSTIQIVTYSDANEGVASLKSIGVGIVVEPDFEGVLQLVYKTLILQKTNSTIIEETIKKMRRERRY